jgi:hypothetical protein
MFTSVLGWPPNGVRSLPRGLMVQFILTGIGINTELIINYDMNVLWQNYRPESTADTKEKCFLTCATWSIIIFPKCRRAF